MKQKFTFLIAALMLLIMMVMPWRVMGQVVSGTTYSTPSVSGLPTGWSGSDGGGTSYIKLTANTHYIQTDNFTQTSISSIVVKARKFNGPSAAQALITVSWYNNNNEETALGTIAPSSTTLSNYTISNPAATSGGTGYIKIQCKGAGSNAGSGVSEVTINFTGASTAYTVTLGDTNETLTEASAGAGVTLPTRSNVSPYTFAGWSTTNNLVETTTAPTIIPAGAYHPSANITLYPVYSRTESTPSVTTWQLTELSAATEGVYALLTTDGHAFNGSISSGHGQVTESTFSFSAGVATEAPSGVCEITFQSVTGGFKMYNSSNGYLYAKDKKAGNLAWHNDESSYWKSASSNWVYNNNSAYLRSLSNSSFRTYGQNNGDVLKLAKKVTTGGTTTYYISVLPTITPSITASNVNIDYNATSGSIEYSISNSVDGGELTASIASSTIVDLIIGTITNTTVSFTCSGNTSFSARTATITLTYTYNTDQTVTTDVTITQAEAPTPTITAGNVEITYDAESGSIVYDINNPSNDGTLTASTSSDWLTLGQVGATVPFTCSANPTYTARTATVTLTYTYNTDQTVVKDVTVTQAANMSVFDNIVSITEVGTSYRIKGTIVAINDKSFVLGDGTGYVQWYGGNTHEYEVNDIVIVNGETSLYGHVIQFTNSATIEESASSNYNGTPVASEITAVPDYTSGNHLSTYLTFEGDLTKSDSKYFITLGDAQIQISYPTTTQSNALDALVGKTVVVYGYFAGINSDEKFTVMLESAEEVIGDDPTISVSLVNLSGFNYLIGNGPSESQTVSVSGVNLTNSISLSLGENSNYEMSLASGSGYTNSLTLNQSEGSVSSTTIYVRLKADLPANNNYSGTITLTSTGATNATVSLSGSVTQPNQTWDLSTNSYSSSTADLVTWSGDYVTMTNAKYNSSTAANNYLGGTNNHTRFYQNQKLTITPTTGYAITSVVITAVSSSYVAGFTGNAWTNATASSSENIVTVTPTTGTQAISVVYSEACRATEVKVYYTAQNSAPVWESLPTPTIAINDEYEITLTEYVTASPAPTITLSSTSVDSDLYEYEDGILMFQTTTAGTYAFTFTATNSVGSANVTLTITVAYTIEFKINGVKDDDLKMFVNAGDALGELPVPATTPNGFAFVGWMESTETPYYNATTQPTMVSSSSEPSGNMTLEAVFCASQWLLTNVAPVDGDKVILAAFDNGTYYAMAGASRLQLAVENDIITTTNLTTPNPIFTVNVSEDNLYLKQGDNYLHVNNSALNVTTNTTNGSVVFNSQDDGSFIVARKNNDRWIRYTGSGFTSASSLENASKLFLFKYISSSSEYTTEVTESIAAGTVSGYNHIFGEVSPTGNITISGNIVIHKGGVLNMGSHSLTNGTAANLIIEDGGQLIVHNDNVQATIKKTVTASAKNPTNWYTIASPVRNVYIGAVDDAGSVKNLKEEHGYYDLYRFNETKNDSGEGDYRWENYKNDDYDDFTNLVTGRGYLYRREGSATLEYVGKVNGNDYEMYTLTMDGASPLKGFHLIGNPYSHDIYKGKGAAIDDTKLNEGFYRLTNGTAWTPALGYGDPIHSGEGILVQANAAGTLTIYNSTTSASGESKYNNDNIMFSVSNSQHEDVAYAVFDKGHGLNKIEHRDANIPMLYISQNGEDYAIAMMSDDTKTFGLSLKATTMGQYTLKLKANGNYTYLHVIDRLTGEDVDMLLEDEYTFVASANDIRERFIVKLGYMPDYSDAENDVIAYQSGDQILVSGEGELQIFDVTGRKVMTTTINGVEAINGLSHGVYIFRVIGENQRTQKIVVR